MNNWGVRRGPTRLLREKKIGSHDKIGGDLGQEWNCKGSGNLYLLEGNMDENMWKI